MQYLYYGLGLSGAKLGKVISLRRLEDLLRAYKPKAVA